MLYLIVSYNVPSSNNIFNDLLWLNLSYILHVVSHVICLLLGMRNKLRTRLVG